MGDQHLLVVTDLMLGDQSRNGFAPRLAAFLDAIADHLAVKVISLAEPDRTSPTTGRIEVIPTGVDRPRYTRLGVAGRAARLWHYSRDPLPYAAQPRRLPELGATIRRQPPAGVLVYLPYLAHLAACVPTHIPVIAGLEERWDRLLHTELQVSGPRRHWVLRGEERRYESIYSSISERAAWGWVISEHEQTAFAPWFGRSLDVLPHGLDLTYFAPERKSPSSADFDVLVVGDMRAPRNSDGALAVWRRSRELTPQSQWRWLFLGECSAPIARELRAGGAVVKAPADVRPYYARSRVTLVPALAGTGVKTTALQAWAMRRPVVLSSHSSRGLPVVDGANALVGASVDGLIDHVRHLLDHREKADALAAAGRDTVAESGDVRKVAELFARRCLAALGLQEQVTARAR